MSLRALLQRKSFIALALYIYIKKNYLEHMKLQTVKYDQMYFKQIFIMH